MITHWRLQTFHMFMLDFRCPVYALSCICVLMGRLSNKIQKFSNGWQPWGIVFNDTSDQCTAQSPKDFRRSIWETTTFQS